MEKPEIPRPGMNIQTTKILVSACQGVFFNAFYLPHQINQSKFLECRGSAFECKGNG